MKHFSRLILSLALFCSARTQAQTAYTIQDLGTLGGDVTVAGLNNHGEVTADFFDNVSTYRSGLYSNGILQDITAKAGPSVGNINDAGQIAGDAYAGANFRAILYNSHTGQTQVIGPYNSAAAVVNQNGVAAGLVYTQPRQTYAALFRNGQATQLISFAGGGDPYNALAINNHDQVVGQGFDAIGECAYLSSGGVSYSLGRLPGGKSAGATGINDSGAIVGYSGSASISPGYSHPFLYQNGVIQDLGTFGGPEGGATAINNAGVVVGDADYLGVGDPTVPFVYSGGVMRNLFDMIPDGSAWNTGFAEAINDNGQIAGEAYHNGGLHIFLATPVAVPEPGA